MRNIFIFLGITFLVLIVIGIVSLALVAIKAARLDKESKQYVDAMIPAIVSDWNKQKLLECASPELLASTKNDDLDKLFSLFQKLGRLREYKGSAGDANVSVTTQHGKVISANYVAKAEFDAGPAEINVALIKHGDNWQVLGFNVSSEIFLEQK
jgi:hypothetical protein